MKYSFQCLLNTEINFKKLQTEIMSPPSYREAKILKQKDFYKLMQEIWEEHKGKTKVRRCYWKKEAGNTL